MPQLQIIIASTRPGRVGLPVGQWFADEARAHGGFKVEVLDLAEIDLPFMDEPKHPRLREYAHQHTKDWSASIEAGDAFVFVMPEYNFGLNAPMKNAIDYPASRMGPQARRLRQLRRRLGGHPRGADGQAGGHRGQAGADDRRGVDPVRRQVPRRRGRLEPNETMTTAADAMLTELLRYAEALASLRSQD